MSRAVRTWFTAAAVLTMVSVAMGAVVCATQSGAACPNWPGCYPDQFTPEASLSPVIEFTHRVIAAATGPTVLVAAILGRRLADPRPRRLAWIGLAGTLAAGVFGMLIVLIGLPWWLGMVDLGSALVATVAMLLARLLLVPGARWAPGRVAKQAWVALGLLWLNHLLAIAVAGTNSFTRCLGWPLGVLPADRWPVVQSVRVWLAVAVAVLIVVAVTGAVVRPGLRLAGWMVGALLAIELGLGLDLLLGGGAIGQRTAYAVVAAGLFGALALLAGLGSVHSVAAQVPKRSCPATSIPVQPGQVVRVAFVDRGQPPGSDGAGHRRQRRAGRQRLDSRRSGRQEGK